jgi:hypothetical protein
MRSEYLTTRWVQRDDPTHAEVMNRALVNNRKACSCEGCGNVRRNLWANPGQGLTRPELLQIQDLKDGLAEVLGPPIEDDEL